MTIQFSSPRTSRVSLAGSICRWDEIDGRLSFESVGRALSSGGLYSHVSISTPRTTDYRSTRTIRGGHLLSREHLVEYRAVHQRQPLPLRLASREHLPGVHPGLDHLQGHQAADRLLLLGQPDFAHAALADHLHEFEPAAEDGPGRRAGWC